jgi:hypothetical protein
VNLRVVPTEFYTFGSHLHGDSLLGISSFPIINRIRYGHHAVGTCFRRCVGVGKQSSPWRSASTLNLALINENSFVRPLCSSFAQIFCVPIFVFPCASNFCFHLRLDLSLWQPAIYEQLYASLNVNFCSRRDFMLRVVLCLEFFVLCLYLFLVMISFDRYHWS